jgi:membrane protease YdiL (CAAX protease family)
VLGVWFALQATLALVAGAVRSTAGNLAVLGASEVLVLGGASLALAYRRATLALPGGLEWARLALGPSSFGLVALGLGAGISIHPLADAIRDVVERFFPTPTEQLEQKLALLGHHGPIDVLALFMVVGLLGPLFEELFYRGVLFTRVLWARGVVAAGWLSGIGFVFAHGDVRDWPSLLLVSALLTWLRARSGSIWAGVAAHVGFNGSTLVLLVFAPNLTLSGIAAGLGVLVAGGLLALAARTTRNDG